MNPDPLLQCFDRLAETSDAIPRLRRFILDEVPPLAEQHRIVAKVDALMSLCDRLEASLMTADNTRCRLLEALLNEALTPARDGRRDRDRRSLGELVSPILRSRFP